MREYETHQPGISFTAFPPASRFAKRISKYLQEKNHPFGTSFQRSSL
jgi:hypothetical protein